MPIGVSRVGVALGQAHADERDCGGEHVGKRMDGVADHGRGIAHDACDELDCRKCHVSAYANRGDLFCDGSLVNARLSRRIRLRCLRHDEPPGCERVVALRGSFSIGRKENAPAGQLLSRRRACVCCQIWPGSMAMRHGLISLRC